LGVGRKTIAAGIAPAFSNSAVAVHEETGRTIPAGGGWTELTKLTKFPAEKILIIL
jgi:hypothetical protein